MSVTYLVDFENVHDLGLSGIHKLSNEDMVNIIYTDNLFHILRNITCHPFTFFVDSSSHRRVK